MRRLSRQVLRSSALRVGAAVGLLAAVWASGCGGGTTSAPGADTPPPALPKPDPKLYRATKKNPSEKIFDPRERLKAAKPG